MKLGEEQVYNVGGRVIRVIPGSIESVFTIKIPIFESVNILESVVVGGFVFNNGLCVPRMSRAVDDSMSWGFLFAKAAAVVGAFWL